MGKFTNPKYRNITITFLVTWLVFDLLIMRGLNNLYLTAPTFDIISHFFFGMFLGGVFLYMKFSKNKALIYSLGISLLWEAIEKFGDLVFSQPYYLLDTFFYDGVTDVIAHLIAVIVIYKYYNKK